MDVVKFICAKADFTGEADVRVQLFDAFENYDMLNEFFGKHGFMRVHRGFIVNPSYVHHVRCTALSLGADRESVPVSRLYKPGVYKELKV